jgi:uncharacterized ParB-like nuclease family protein
MRAHGGGATTAERKKALAEAEACLVRPRADESREILLSPLEIETRPKLFQPREFSMGARETDKAHVGKLQRRTNAVGELDPVTVVKLGDLWVIADGHHRLEAYRKNKREEPIQCEWFDGTAREAMDVAMRRNNMLKLEVSRQSRDEEAWKRVLIGGYTREQIRQTCAVGTKLITHMRRVRDRYLGKGDYKRDRGKLTKQFRKDVEDIEECSWAKASMAFINATPKEHTQEQEAQTLARWMRERLGKDPEVTARAMVIYDRALPANLIRAWSKAKGYEVDTGFEYVDDDAVNGADSPDVAGDL